MKEVDELREQLAEALIALGGTVAELDDVVESINHDRIHFDGDGFHERLEAGRSVLNKHKGFSHE